MPTPRGRNCAQKCTLSAELVRTSPCAGASDSQADIARQQEGPSRHEPPRQRRIPHRPASACCSLFVASGEGGTVRPRPAAHSSGRNLRTADSMGTRGKQLIEHFRSASAYPRNFRPSRRRDSLRRRHVRQVREIRRRNPSDLTDQGRSRPDQGRERRDPRHVGRRSVEGT